MEWLSGRENNPTMSSNSCLFPSSSSSSTSGGVNYIEHHVSKLDTLAGVAIKYGVEVADIKRMNGLVTDLQMFALKYLKIPLPGRHPPSPGLSNGSATPGKSCSERTPSHRSHSDSLELFQSLRLKSPQHKVSSAMSTLQGYYGLKPSNNIGATEGTEMAVYKMDKAHHLEDGRLPKPSPCSDPALRRHPKSGSLINGFLPENGELAEDVPVAAAGDGEAEKFNEKSVRRRQKTEIDSGSRASEMLMEDNSGSNGFSASNGKGLAVRPKSVSRTSLASDAESGWLNPIPVGLGDSLIADGSVGVQKSSSTSSLQDQDNNNSSSIWPTSKWSLKSDLQALSTAAITRPIFDGLPKPITGRRNKAALD